MKGKISFIDQNNFLYQTLNLLFFAVKLTILTWGLMRCCSVLEPASSGQSMNCSLSHFRLGLTSETERDVLIFNDINPYPCDLWTVVHKMIILGSEELKEAERVLKPHFPESLKVYGCIFNINRGKPHNLEIIADQWPDFSAIICKPKVKGVKDREGDFNIYSIYSKSKDALKELLKTPGVIDTDAFTLLAGVDVRHLAAVREFADERGIPWKIQCVMNVLMLQESTRLDFKLSDPGLKFRPVSSSHAHLVNSTWKYGDANSYNSVLNYITHNPSLCIMEDGCEPVSWLLLYQHCALGLLYTVPQHRRKGYAKLLVSVLSQKLLGQGYPVYGFVEEENEPSYELFTSLGFEHSAQYKSVWFELNKQE